MNPKLRDRIGMERKENALVYTGTPADLDAVARAVATGEDAIEALNYAAKLIETARRYFPKSMKNSDKFNLENTCATVGKAIHKAEGRGQ